MKTIFILLALAFAGNAAAEPQPNTPAVKSAPASKFTNKGTVLEVIDTSMYTYMQVSTENGPIWLAASKTKVAKGADINYPNGANMANFHSKSLNRTFDKIIFLDKVQIVKK
ncbi:MAG: NrfJ [Gallionella sp.]